MSDALKVDVYAASDSRQARMVAALEGFRDSDNWSPSIRKISKAALPHFYESKSNVVNCVLCGCPPSDMIHIAFAANRT